jgi:putative membrane protein
MKKLLCALMLAVPVVALPVVARAGTPSPIADNKLVEVDTQVVAHQHAVNLEEIAMGKLARANSTSATVKKYGATLVKDHTSGDKDIKAFAKAKTLKLEALRGPAFDHMFLAMMAAGHDKEVTRITADIAQATNKNLVTILTKIKPVLQAHADAAHGLQTATPSAGTK